MEEKIVPVAQTECGVAVDEPVASKHSSRFSGLIVAQTLGSF